MINELQSFASAMDTHGVDALAMAAASIASRCRYKTGRCPYARAVKSNGAMLLLCEYHRAQQNRTKKRSDIKCRPNRIMKRQAEREKQRGAKHQRLLTVPTRKLAKPQPVPLAPSSPLITTGPIAIDRSKNSRVSTGSPAAADDIDSVYDPWTPHCVMPVTTPTCSAGDGEDFSDWAPEDAWLLEYFIL